MEFSVIWQYVSINLANGLALEPLLTQITDAYMRH